MLGDVAIAVVEGEAGEAPVVALLEPQHGLIEGDHVEPCLLHLIEHSIEEFRRHLEDAIGRETHSAGRARDGHGAG